MISPSDGYRSTGPLTELSEEVCREHLAQHSAGRIGFLTPAGPQILPVTYQFRNGNVVFRTSPSGVLSGLVRRSTVAFEIDEIDEQTHSGWSVLVLGFAQAMAHNALLTSAWETGPVPWAEGTRNLFIEITPRTISGRLLGAATTVS
jgi:nitroimidazol reductase NimA-like FMN-containing flavoprotein (pyridoxamine 5'-phosphate oxidase superfamily)